MVGILKNETLGLLHIQSSTGRIQKPSQNLQNQHHNPISATYDYLFLYIYTGEISNAQFKHSMPLNTSFCFCFCYVISVFSIVILILSPRNHIQQTYFRFQQAHQYTKQQSNIIHTKNKRSIKTIKIQYTFKSVDLPQPLGPRSIHNCPEGIRIEQSLRMGVSWPRRVVTEQLRLCPSMASF